MTTETTTVESPTTFAPPPVGTDKQISYAREKWIERGFDPAKFDAAIAGTSANYTDQSEGYQVENAAGELSKSPPVSPEQAERMANALRRQGVAEDRIQAALAADGIAIEPDSRSEAERRHDQSFGMSPEGEYLASDYRPLHNPAVLAMGETLVASAHAEGTEFLEALQIRPAIGNFLIERAEALGQKFAQASAAGIALWKAEQRNQLLRHYNMDAAKVDEKVALASQTIRLALAGSDKAARYADALVNSVAANDVFIVETLAAHAAHINRWAASRPGVPK